MKRLVFLVITTSSSILFISHAHAKSDWSYKGKSGPEYWGKISSRYRACSDGNSQSPINITGGVNVAQTKITYTYKGSGYEVVNNGHTLQVTTKPGSKIELEKQIYNLKHMHLHTPGEHKISGRSYLMEAHLVHSDNKGTLTVIAVMFRSGRDNKSIAAILQSAPKKRGSNPLLKPLNLSKLLPQNKDHFTYTGSLTMPPCTEGVRWIVMKNPITASDKQMKKLKQIMGANSRPIQPLNSRMITK